MFESKRFDIEVDLRKVLDALRVAVERALASQDEGSLKCPGTNITQIPLASQLAS